MLSSADFNATFQTFIDSLNPEQRQAVDQIDGPLLVVAGPGTGKTQVLAARIGRILTETDTPAASILCLTFSDAGAHAMRRRLLQLIGPDAHRVTISTFHSFCNRVIQENLVYFGNPHLRLITDLERIEVIRKLLLELPLDHPLREGRKNPYVFEAQLRGLFAMMKREGWSVAFMEDHIRTFVNGLESNPEYLYKRKNRNGEKGDPNLGKIKEMRDKMDRLLTAVRLYPQYEEMLAAAGRYEYDDMLLWVIGAFSAHEGLLRTYQEQYLYILVDEYQDTNGAQYQLLQLLLDFWETPNVFIVGDDDQSIYEFQGARLQNLVDFHKHYSPSETPQVLVRNYRSGQNLLDVAGQLIEKNKLRAVNELPVNIDKHLLSQRDEPALIRATVFENALHEWSGVVQQIKSLLENEVPADQIAVLYTRHKSGEPLLRLLQQAGIPCQVKRPTDVLAIPLVEHLVDILDYLNLEGRQPFEGEGLLFRILHAPWWGLDSIDLAQLALYRQHDSFERNFRKLLASPEQLEEAGVQAADKLIAIGERLENLIRLSQYESIPELLAQVWTQSGLLEHVMHHSDRVWMLQALGTFQDFVQEELLRLPGMRLPGLLSLIERMRENRLELPMRSNIESREGVHLLTAHAAKGLEFDHVFMPVCTADAWEPGARSYSTQMALPDTLVPSGEQDVLEARRRLFYVAMTRARKGLYLSYARHDDKGKAVQGARFIDEAGIPVETAAPQPTVAATAQNTLLQPIAQPVIRLPEKDWLEQRLQQFTLSITALNRYLRCPLAFYYEDVLRVPAPMRPAAAFGQAIHAALQHFFLREGAPAEILLRDFEAEMRRRKGFFGPELYEQQLAAGKAMLERYHRDQSPRWKPKSVVERRIDRCEWKGIPITGAIDRIEWQEDESLHLIDFKTGRPQPSKAKGPSEKQPQGGDFWRQLVFYAILLKASNMFPGTVARKGVLSWIEPNANDKLVEETMEYQLSDLDFVGKLIEEVYAGIQSHAFDTGCGKPDCVWCRMHQDQSGVPEVPEEEEVLDDEGYLRGE